MFSIYFSKNFIDNQKLTLRKILGVFLYNLKKTQKLSTKLAFLSPLLQVIFEYMLVSYKPPLSIEVINNVGHTTF